MDKLQYRDDYPKPVPQPDQVLVRVLACGLNNTDVNTRTGWYSLRETDPITGKAFNHTVANDAAWGGKPLSFPRIQGADVCGLVEECGSNAPSGLVGQRVLIDPWLRLWSEPDRREEIGYFGSETDGGFAEFTMADHRQIHPIDSEFSDSELATFATSWGTAHYMLERISAGRNDTVLVTGASGGVGSAIMQLAQLRGARVIAMCSEGKMEKVLELGANAVLPRSPENLVDALAAQGFDGVTVVADVVGGAIFPELVRVLKPQGRYVVSGAIGGPNAKFDLRVLYLRDLSFAGVSVPEQGAFAKLVRIIETGAVKPLVAAEFPLADLSDAQRMFMEKKHVGNITMLP